MAGGAVDQVLCTKVKKLLLCDKHPVILVLIPVMKDLLISLHKYLIF